MSQETNEDLVKEIRSLSTLAISTMESLEEILKRYKLQLQFFIEYGANCFILILEMFLWWYEWANKFVFKRCKVVLLSKLYKRFYLHVFPRLVTIDAQWRDMIHGDYCSRKVGFYTEDNIGIHDFQFCFIVKERKMLYFLSQSWVDLILFKITIELWWSASQGAHSSLKMARESWLIEHLAR